MRWFTIVLAALVLEGCHVLDVNCLAIEVSAVRGLAR